MIKSVYISSLPRSGSTLLSMLLGSHDSVCSLGEFVLFGHTLQSNSACSCGKPIRECDFWSRIIEILNLRSASNEQFDCTNFNTLVYPFDYMTSWLQRMLVKVYTHALEEQNRFWMDVASFYKNAFPYQAEKAFTNTVILFEILSAYFSDKETVLLDASKTTTRLNQLVTRHPFPVNVIALVRDGRGTVNSWLKNGKTSFDDTVRSWRFHMEEQIGVLNKIKAREKLLVSYEDLCKDPGSELIRICNFLQIPFQDRMLAMEGPFHMLGGNPGTYEKAKKIRVDTGWTEKFTAEQLTIFEKLAGSLNRDQGYE